jgi:protein KRI1
MPPLLSDSESESDTPQTTFKVNEAYAARLEHNKKREELHRLESKYGKDIPLNRNQNDEEDEEDSSTSESEDEVGELVTPQIDAEIWRTIAMIREGRPEVYDEKWTGFNESEEAVQKEKKEKVIPV